MDKGSPAELAASQFAGEPYVAVGIPCYLTPPFFWLPVREEEVANFRKNSLAKLEACIWLL
jgi:hypothetical protein